MIDPMIVSSTTSELDSLLQKLIAGSEKVQQQLITDLVQLGDDGLNVLQEFLLQRRQSTATWIDGKVYQILYNSDTPTTQEFLLNHFPQGLVPLRSEAKIDYTPLQDALIRKEFQTADLLTIQKMCELAGPLAVKRKWLYFTEVEGFSGTDLRTINHLWVVYSEGKFGFSVQRQIWAGVGKNWENFWPKIGWKNGNNWTRYPGGFTWDLSAPRGHLPLSNQLRGVRVIASLYAHRAWNE